MIASLWRTAVPYAVSVVALLPAIYLMLRPLRAPGDPVPTGRVRGPEANIWVTVPNSVSRFELLVNGGPEFCYHLNLNRPICLQLVGEARIEPDEQTMYMLNRYGGRVVSVQRDYAQVQEYYLPVIPGLWSVSGKSLGGITQGTTQWRVLTPALQSQTRTLNGILHTYIPHASLEKSGSSGVSNQGDLLNYIPDESNGQLFAEEFHDHAVGLTVFLGDNDRVDAVSEALRYERGFAKALHGAGASVAPVDLTVTDLRRVGLRERLLFVGGVGFGLAASILATLLVEWSKH